MDINKLEPGTSESINVLITSEKDSRNYCELDERSGMFVLKRVLSQPLPGYYGFVPRTHQIDADPVDAIILSEEPIDQGLVVHARPIGLIRLTGKLPDDVIIAVLIGDMSLQKTQDLLTLNKEELDKLKNFLEELKGKEVQNVFDASYAKRSFERAVELYKRAFK